MRRPGLVTGVFYRLVVPGWWPLTPPAKKELHEEPPGHQQDHEHRQASQVAAALPHHPASLPRPLERTYRLGLIKERHQVLVGLGLM